MTDEEKLALFNELHGLGIRFYSGMPDVCGQRDVFLEPNDILSFIQDKEDWFARQNGVSKTDYINWLNSGGAPQCGVILKNGKRCKNLVSGGIQMSLQVWLNEDAGFCRIHGGRPSRKSK